ncbi:MAG: lipoprotein-releasing system ATP-binding protein LolD [Proteobacteria bacterium]|nr:MAG: lipoprotein-releasing system ATP-binding protein LolD [Pseudomonadota bacterium]
MSSILEVSNISKSYDNGKTLALKDISINFKEGRFYTIMGKSGCGKSTLLNILGTIDKPTSGEVLYGGKSLEDISRLSDFRRKFIGFIFQFHHLIPVLTLKENVEVALFSNLNYSKKFINEKSIKLLTELGLKNKINSLANEVSGGEKQRCAIARALANNPKIILADEPTGNVDTTNTKVILDQLKKYQEQQNCTIIMATHDLSIAQSSDVIIRLQDGKIISSKENV